MGSVAPGTRGPAPPRMGLARVGRNGDASSRAKRPAALPHQFLPESGTSLCSGALRTCQTLGACLRGKCAPPTPTTSLKMTAQRWTMTIAGLFVLISLGLAQWQGTIDLTKMSWLWFTAFVGANLFQSGLTNFCPLTRILKAAGVK